MKKTLKKNSNKIIKSNFNKNRHYKKKVKLWRKLSQKIFGIVTENFNLWRKALRHNFIRHKLIYDGSVTICDGNCDGQKSVTIFCDGKFVTETVRHKNFVTEIVTDLFRQKKFVTEIVTENPSQFPEVELPLGR